MGLGDIGTTVLVKHKHDIKDAKSKLRELSGEEKKRHKALIDGMEAQNKKIDDQIEFYGKLALGVGAVAGAWLAVDAGFETYEKNSRLRAANLTTDIGGLKDATRGLLNETELLEFSAKAMNGTWAISQEQTEQVLQGALALRKTMGIDLKDALDRVGQAINEANIEPLKELGIVIKAENETMEAQQAIIGALSAEYDKLGGNVDLAGDSVTRSKTDFANSVDSIKESLGKIAIALAPVVAMAADLVANVASLINHAKSIPGRGDVGLTVSDSATDKMANFLNRGSIVGNVGKAQADAQALIGWLTSPGGGGIDPGSRGGGSLGVSAIGMGLALRDDIRKGQRGKRDRGNADVSLGGLLGARASNSSILGAAQLPGFEGTGAGLGLPGAIEGAEIPGIAGRPTSKSDFASYEAFQTASLQNTLAFQTFEATFVEGMANMAMGADSFSEAFKKALGKQSISLGMMAFKEAGYHLARGIGGNPAGFAAAAAYTAAGVGLVALGRQMGGTGGGGSAGNAPSVSGLGAGAAGGRGGGAQVLLLDNTFTDRPARARAADFRRAGRKAGLTFSGDVVEDR